MMNGVKGYEPGRTTAEFLAVRPECAQSAAEPDSAQDNQPASEPAAQPAAERPKPEPEPEPEPEEVTEEVTQELATVRYAATEVGSIAAQLTLAIDFASLETGTPERVAFESRFQEDVAVALGHIDVNRVRIKSIRAGSTVVVFLVLPSYNGTPMATTVVTEAFSSDGILIAGSATTSGVTNVVVVTDNMIVTTQTHNPAPEQQQTTQLTMLIVAVIGLGVVVSVCGCVVVAYARSSQQAKAQAHAQAQAQAQAQLQAPVLAPTAAMASAPPADALNAIEEGVPPKPLLSECVSGVDVLHTVVSSQLESSWAKRSEYEFREVVRLPSNLFAQLIASILQSYIIHIETCVQRHPYTMFVY
eukprot:COSAG06_NODE_3470_length_5297_cov_18.285879_2_plen_359_part_00